MEVPQEENPLRLPESSLEHLPDDLVVEILIRIRGYKCLFRCKSVCKLWFSLISNTDFGCRYISLHPSMSKILKNLPFTFIGCPVGGSNPKLIFSRDPTFQSSAFAFNFLPFSPRIYILETFNDLVLCCDFDNIYIEPVYYICNPLTMQWTALPPAPPVEGFGGSYSVFVRFICEPYCKEEPIHENYRTVVKVVRIILGCGKFCLQIFSSQIGQWTQTAARWLPRNMEFSGGFEAVACNNGTKLILVGRNVKLNSMEPLVSITIEGENFDRIRKTKVHSIRLTYDCEEPFTLCTRSLRLAQLNWRYNLEIWQLEGSRKWKLVQNVNIYKKIAIYESKSMNFPRLLGFDPHDRNILYINLDCDGLVSYNIRRRTLNLVSNVGLEGFHWFYPFAFPLWPTPVPQIEDSMFIDN